MSKEKQIEEMARIICNLCTEEGCLCDGGYCNFNCNDYERAKRLYNAGYRKQREGEWKLEHETYGEMRCSVCGKECPIERKPDPYEDYQMTDFYVTSTFCPNCGAKMKGE